MRLCRIIYNFFIQNHEFKEKNTLPYIREHIFNGLMAVLFFFGTLAIIPNIIASIKHGNNFITIVDLFIYALVLLLIVYKKIKLRLKVLVVIVSIYILSITLLLVLGPLGPGFIWLIASSLIAALIIGLRASVATIIINLVLIVLIAIAIEQEIFNTPFFDAYSVDSWVAISLNLIIVNSITSVPLALLIDNLEKTKQSELRLKKELMEKNLLLQKDKEKAVESDRLKSTFLANLSHDIRTPLNAILGFSELIQMEAENENMKNYSQQIETSSKYLQNLISDVVDISLIESGQKRLEYKRVSFKKILDELKPILYSYQKRKNKTEIKVNFDLEVDITKEYLLDEGHLKQILMNLCTNAIKYTMGGEVNLSVFEQEKILHFIVKDTGIGIPDKEQSKIFTRFSKIKRSKELPIKGIGLGLSISKALVEAMGGHIWFESKENEGSTFGFEIPVKL